MDRHRDIEIFMCIYMYIEIYYNGLFHMIMEAKKSLNLPSMIWDSGKPVMQFHLSLKNHGGEGSM